MTALAKSQINEGRLVFLESSKAQRRRRIFLIACGDSEILRLSQSLELESCRMHHFTSVPTPNELDRLSPSVLVVQGSLNPSLLRKVSSLRLESGIPLVGLLEENSLDKVEDYSWDDFVLKPWTAKEVLLRLRRLSARNSLESGSSVLNWGQVSIDIDRYKVQVKGKDLDFTYTELRLLTFMVSHGQSVVTREDIFKHLWGEDFYGGMRAIETHVRRIRSKLQARGYDCIEIVRKVGYRLILPE